MSDGSNSVVNFATLSALNAGADYDTVIGATLQGLLTAASIDTSELNGVLAMNTGVTLYTQITDARMLYAMMV